MGYYSSYQRECTKHFVAMSEKLDDTRTKIIPYCVHCDAITELTKITSEQQTKYQNELDMYQKTVMPFSKRKPIEFTFSVILFVLGILLLVSGIVSVSMGTSQKLFLISVAGVPLFLAGGATLYGNYNVKLDPPLIPVRPTLDNVIQSNKELAVSRQAEVEAYKVRLESQYKRQIVKNVEIQEIDSMSGFEFEEYVAKLLEKLGYSKSTVTQKSGDFGADIIAIDSNNVKVAVQCKRYGTKNSVGNDAIQQIYSAMSYFDCQKAIVVTTSYFTNPAFQMAKKLGVELWNRKTLTEKIGSISEESWNDYLAKYYIRPANQTMFVKQEMNKLHM